MAVLQVYCAATNDFGMARTGQNLKFRQQHSIGKTAKVKSKK